MYVHGSRGRGFCRIFQNDTAIVVAFRGTREKYDWRLANLRFLPEPLRDGGPGSERVRVHRGFQQSLYYRDRTSGEVGFERMVQVLAGLPVGNRELWITGHSLGAAIAVLFAAKLRARMPDLVEGNLRGIVLFGSPAVGGSAFRAYYGSLNAITVRYIHGVDPVPLTPPVGFRHVGSGHWFNNGKWGPDPGWTARLRLAVRRRPRTWATDHSMDAYISALSGAAPE